MDFLIFYVGKGTSLKHISMRPEQQPNSKSWNMIFDESDGCYGFFNTEDIKLSPQILKFNRPAMVLSERWV